MTGAKVLAFRKFRTALESILAPMDGSAQTFNSNAAQAIVAIAAVEHCSLIFMGSHGRGGLSRMFLGSVALKTLTPAHDAVLVDHPKPEEIAQLETLMKENAIEA